MYIQIFSVTMLKHLHWNVGNDKRYRRQYREADRVALVSKVCVAVALVSVGNKCTH